MSVVVDVSVVVDGIGNVVGFQRRLTRNEAIFLPGNDSVHDADAVNAHVYVYVYVYDHDFRQLAI